MYSKVYLCKKTGQFNVGIFGKNGNLMFNDVVYILNKGNKKAEKKDNLIGKTITVTIDGKNYEAELKEGK